MPAGQRNRPGRHADEPERKLINAVGVKNRRFPPDLERGNGLPDDEIALKLWQSAAQHFVQTRHASL